jgi:serine/threonine-protein kinase
MANVWLARLGGKAGQLFAVKTILPHVAHDPAFKMMFLDEARIASRIDHPNVVRMVDVGEFAGIPYLVMDLVEGEPLFRLPKACERLGRRMPLGVVLRVLADASHGLHAAHELRNEAGTLLNVVHRDMSPQNILVSTAGHSLLIDFGVAKAVDRTAQQTSAGTLKGKISYMPREQACGEEVDRRADTWALGAVLYYLLSGRPPYKEDSQLATLQLAMSGAPIPPLSDAMPASLRALVTRALSQDPTERYQTAEELGDELEALMRRLGIHTTHAEVGGFVSQVMSDRLESRRQLIHTALTEAVHRESARTMMLSNPLTQRGPEEQSSLNEGMVSMPAVAAERSPALSQTSVLVPTAPFAPPSGPMLPIGPPSVPALRVVGPEPPQEPSTAGAFVAFSDTSKTVVASKSSARWPTYALAGGLGLGGIALIIAALVVPSRRGSAAGARIEQAPVRATASVATVDAPQPTVAAAPSPSPSPVETAPPVDMTPPVVTAAPPAVTPAPQPVALAPPELPATPAAVVVTSPPRSQPPPTRASPPPAAKPPPRPTPVTSPRRKRDDEAGF